MMLQTAFFGTPNFAVPILQRLMDVTHVRVVVTQSPKPVGKNLQLQLSPIHKLALDHAIPVLSPLKIKDTDFRSTLLSNNVDLAVVAAYGKILPAWILEWPRMNAVNVHGSLLPKYRGASPIAAAILHGEAISGITYMQMNVAMDEGPMLEKYQVSLAKDETMESLATKLSLLAATTLPDFLRQYAEGSMLAKPQDDSEATYTHLLTKEDGRIDFSTPPIDLERRIRAFYPWPGVWGIFRDKRVKLLPNNIVQMEGKKATGLSDFKRGYPEFPI
jgi:methionyl-tRNA formyltransferase